MPAVGSAVVEGAASPIDPEPLLIDAVLDRYDTSISAHTIVDAPTAVTFEQARSLDFMSIRTPLLTASFFVRDLPARLLGRPRPPAPPEMRLVGADGLDLPGWLLLGERPGHEIVFGAIGRFWTPTITWNDTIDAGDFAGFDDPGWGKIACNFAVTAYGTHRSLLTYECRTLITDPSSAARFGRYWSLVRPFVGHVLRATVATIRDDVEGLVVP